jgi:hypothetical protein
MDETNYIYISGMLNPDGTGIFYPFESFDFNSNAATEPQEKHYKIVYEDKIGKTISEFNFEPNGYDIDKSQSLFFSLTLPFDKDAEHIKLLHDNKEIAVRSKSPNAPVLDISSLSNISELKGKLTLSWKASDADGDPLIYSVDYSTNNGNSWMPMRVLLSQPSTEVDADFLPGTNQGLLRVSVSDGFNTSTSQISHVISVSKKKPEITMLPLISSEKESFPLVIEATAFDCEDGPISDETSFIWTSDKDGTIATGHWAVLNDLSEGRHILTLTVIDSDGISHQFNNYQFPKEIIKMKTFKIFYLFFVLLFLVSGIVFSQVQVIFQQPPPNQLYIEDIWKITLNNPTSTAFTVYLTGNATETQKGQILSGTTKNFTLPPGLKVLSSGQMGEIDIDYKNSEIKDIIKNTGSVPAGFYNIYISVFNFSDNQLIGIHVF